MSFDRISGSTAENANSLYLLVFLFFTLIMRTTIRRTAVVILFYRTAVAPLFGGRVASRYNQTRAENKGWKSLGVFFKTKISARITGSARVCVGRRGSGLIRVLLLRRRRRRLWWWRRIIALKSFCSAKLNSAVIRAARAEEGRQERVRAALTDCGNF